MFNVQTMAALEQPDHLFTSAPVRQANAPGVTKTAGAGDSVKNQKSSTKAPGGHDASKQKDGG